MNFPKREIVDKIKKEYPKGTRVELIAMDDPYSKLKPGDKGTVRSVDDTATIHVNWDNHSCLGIVYGEDSCRKLHTVKTICYGEEQVWDKREGIHGILYIVAQTTPTRLLFWKRE
jgi:hypothetical protein